MASGEATLQMSLSGEGFSCSSLHCRAAQRALSSCTQDGGAASGSASGHGGSLAAQQRASISERDTQLLALTQARSTGLYRRMRSRQTRTAAAGASKEGNGVLHDDGTCVCSAVKRWAHIIYAAHAQQCLAHPSG